MPKKPKKDEMITLTQAAEMSGFAVAYLQKLAQRGRLKCRKFGNLWVTTPAGKEWFERNSAEYYIKELPL